MSAMFTRLSSGTMIVWTRVISILIISVSSSSGGTLNITENTAVHVGEPLVLSCSATHEGSALQILNSSGQLVANSHRSMNASKWFILKNDDRHLAILIHVTQLSDAGKYWCEDGRNQAVGGVSTQVVVLDHSPTCSLNTSILSAKEFEEVSMRCGTGYRGSWAPSIHWQDDNGQRITAGISNVTNSSHVTSVLRFTASASHHGAVYKCVIMFDNFSQIVPQANVWSNTPSYQRTCHGPALNIFFGARNISINPLKDFYLIKSEESVRCSAGGNPTPTCYWYNIQMNINETTGDTFHITASMNETVLFFQCRCFNYINSTAKDFSFNVTASFTESVDRSESDMSVSTTPSTVTVIVTIFSVTTALLIIIIIILAGWILFKRDAPPSSSLDNAQYVQLAQVSPTIKPVTAAPVYAALTQVYQEVGSLDNAYMQPAQVSPTKQVAPVYAALTEVYQEVQ